MRLAKMKDLAHGRRCIARALEGVDDGEARAQRRVSVSTEALDLVVVDGAGRLRAQPSQERRARRHAEGHLREGQAKGGALPGEARQVRCVARGRGVAEAKVGA